MAAPKTFNNVIIGQFVLTGVPVKVYASGRFLTVTDADDVENPLIGFGMDEDGQMIQFSYPEVEFLQVVGNKIDIATYNKGMETLHSGDEAPADKEEPAEDEGGDDKAGEEDKAAEGPPMSDSIMPKLVTLLEGPAAEKAQQQIDKLKADLIKAKEDKLEAEKEELGEDHVTSGMSAGQEYTFGTGDIVNNKNTNCIHYGSKGIVIGIPQQGLIRYTVTNTGDTFKPGDILTKTSDQLEKI
tara:strand:+ start:199 stop:921 length:723 start_codon:yes stop_codon:yes gene_type:complete